MNIYSCFKICFDILKKKHIIVIVTRDIREQLCLSKVFIIPKVDESKSAKVKLKQFIVETVLKKTLKV